MVTLRAHCRGQKHKQKALQKEKDLKKKPVAGGSAGKVSTSYVNTRSPKMDIMDMDDLRVRGIKRERSRSPTNIIHRVKNLKLDEDDIVEVSRIGNFKNWSTVKIKTTSNDHGSNGHQSPLTVTTLEEAIERLHRRVANLVMENINKYYPGTEDFDPALHKIHDKDDYTRTAKMLSHSIRAKIKVSYEAYNGTLEGISLTGDHKAFIKSQVERHFDQIPIIQICHNNNETFEPMPDENYKKLVTIEEKALKLKEEFARIDINNIRQSPGCNWLHLSEKGLKESLKQGNRLNEEMQKLLESLDGVNLLADQNGKINFKDVFIAK